VKRLEKKVASNKRRENVMFKHWIALLALVGALAVVSAAAAEKQYGPGVTDKEIKIGQTSAYSGPASAYGALLSKTQVAYIRMINEHGGN
jgi:branched-chain amino acid transport system substrate-binding protein